jgi:thioredoxin-dependent peroxiredoxin
VTTGKVTLEIGDAAPDFALLDQHEVKVTLSDYRGEKVLVYFYPEADTPGCTTQSCDLRDHRQDLANLGVDVVGISPDMPEAQLAFDRKYGLGFPLLSDPDHVTAEAWGTWGDVSTPEIVRSSFLVDEDGRIERSWYRIKAADTVPAALETLSG